MEGVRKHSLLAGVVLLVAGFITFEFLPERPGIHLAVLGLGGVVLALGVFWNRAAVVELVRGRAVRSAAAAAGYSAAVLAIWVLVNWLGTRHHHRFDFTEEGVFTLDARTVAELQRIDRPVEVIAFVADADEGSRQRIRDLLEEYRYHQDRITYRFVDPFKNPGEVEQHQITEENTLVLRSGDQTTKVVGLEEEKITGAINKVRVDRKKTVYFTRGHGEREIDDFQPRGTSNVRDALTGLQYEVKSVQLAQEERVPEEATVVAVVGPEAPLLEPEAGMVREFLASGGSLLLLAEPGQPHGLDAVLAGYGLKVNDDRVINVNQISRLLGFDANVPMGVEYGAHPIVEGLRVSTFFPVAASVETLDSGVDPNVETQYLVHTDPESWGERNREEIRSGRVTWDEGEDRAGPVPLGAAASVPVPEAGGEEAAAGEGTEGAEGTEDSPGDAAPPRRSRVVVFGDSSFASNQFMNLQGNADLVLKAFEWLAEGEAAIPIPPKRPKSRTLTLNEGQARAIRYAGVFGLPLTFAILAVAVWVRRRHL